GDGRQRRHQRARLKPEVFERAIVDLIGARHLLHHQLTVHVYADTYGLVASNSFQPQNQRTIFRLVVSHDAEILLALRDQFAIQRLHDDPCRRMSRVAARGAIRPHDERPPFHLLSLTHLRTTPFDWPGVYLQDISPDILANASALYRAAPHERRRHCPEWMGVHQPGSAERQTSSV